MSQDLLSFLDDTSSQNYSIAPTPGRYQTQSTNNPWAEQDSAPTPADPIGDDEDDFGDFEDASASIPAPVLPNPSDSKAPQIKHRISDVPKPNPSPKSTSLPFSPRPPETKQEGIGQHPFAGHMDMLFDDGDDEYDAGADELGDLATNPEAAMAYSKRIIAEQEAAAANAWRSEPRTKVGGGSNPAIKNNAQPDPVKLIKPKSKDPNVLFDADDVSEDEDDFGGFESGNENVQNDLSPPKQVSKPTGSSMSAVDLLGLDDDLPMAQTQNSTNGTFQKQGSPVKHVVQSQKYEEDNDTWDDFETATPDEPTSAIPPTRQSFQYQPQPSTKSPPQSESSLPPTNIPPPSVLISLFPSILAEADDALFNAIGRLDLKQRQMLLGHPASHQFLKGYLGHAAVMARIIAGRKLRWKRDQHLTQSMRIGPAAAGGKGGMKLTGLDKAESTKEDREVVDALRLWRAQVGKLRTAVSAASAMPASAKLPAVPEITEQMPVRALKEVEGGITASHACALCGLKREERVAKVDVEVDDIFGEWWIQGMNMHVSCRDFWTELERKLRSR